MPPTDPEALGSRSRYAPAMDSIAARTRSKTRGAGVAAAEANVGGRPSKRRRRAQDKLVLEMQIKRKAEKDPRGKEDGLPPRGVEDEGAKAGAEDHKETVSWREMHYDLAAADVICNL